MDVATSLHVMAGATMIVASLGHCLVAKRRIAPLLARESNLPASQRRQLAVTWQFTGGSMFVLGVLVISMSWHGALDGARHDIELGAIGSFYSIFGLWAARATWSRWPLVHAFLGILVLSGTAL